MPGNICWTEVSGSLHCINKDGSEMKTIFTSSYTPLDFAFDTSGGRIFWAEYTGTVYQIRRIGIDGSGSAVVYSSEYGPTAIGIDKSNGTIFWNEYHGTHDIWKSGPSFNVVSKEKWFVNLANNNNYTYSICVDSINGKFYCTANKYYDIGMTLGSSNAGTVYSGNIDTYDSESIGSSSLNGPTAESVPFKGMAVDVDGEHVYYVNNIVHGTYPKNITKTDLSLGSPAIWIYQGVADIQKIALDLVNRKIYWTSESDNSIYRADLDSSNSNIEKFLQLDSKPTGIAIFQ